MLLNCHASVGSKRLNAMNHLLALSRTKAANCAYCFPDPYLLPPSVFKDSWSAALCILRLLHVKTVCTYIIAKVWICVRVSVCSTDCWAAVCDFKCLDFTTGVQFYRCVLRHILFVHNCTIKNKKLWKRCHTFGPGTFEVDWSACN